MRKDIEFQTEDGVTLRGWLYLPDQARGRVPTIVMAHGFSAVKENYLDRYAEVFSASDLGVLVFDNRNFGASGGEPRQHIDPWRQVGDYRDAITYSRTIPELDGNRIGIWGSATVARMSLRGARPSSEVRGIAGTLDQRPPKRAAPDQSRHYRRSAADVCGRSGGPLCR